MVTRLTFWAVERLVELTLFCLTIVAETPRDLKYATTAAFLAFPSDFEDAIARSEVRVKVILVLPLRVSTKSRTISF